MVEIYVLNPTDALSTLDAISKSQEDTIIFRISETSGTSILKSEIMVKTSSTRRSYDEDISGRDIELYGEDSNLDACVELLKAGIDVDISLSTGYTVFEVPAACSDPAQVESDCFLTLDNLYCYLVSVNATTYFEGEIGRWKGIEQIVDAHYMQSTMVFSVSYRYAEFTKSDAISYLQSIIGKNTPTSIAKRSSGSIRANIYVVKNTPCVIPIIKEHPLYTVPVSKQRLLYIFDCIHAWLNLNTRRWIEVKFNTTPVNTRENLKCFQYKIEKIQSWTSFPTLSIDSHRMIKDLSISITHQWKGFYTAQTIRERIETVITLLNEFGIDMKFDNFAGQVEDYVENRQSFTIPTRTAVVSTDTRSEIAIPLPKSRGRGRRA